MSLLASGRPSRPSRPSRGPSSGSRTRSCFPAGPWTRRRCRPRLLLGVRRISRYSFPFSFGRSALPTILVGVSSSTFPNCRAIPVVRSAGSAVVSGSSRLTAFCIPPGVRQEEGRDRRRYRVRYWLRCDAQISRRRRRRRCERSSSRTRMTMMIRSRAPPPGSTGSSHSCAAGGLGAGGCPSGRRASAAGWTSCGAGRGRRRARRWRS